MKKLFFITILFIGLISCSDNETDECLKSVYNEYNEQIERMHDDFNSSPIHIQENLRASYEERLRQLERQKDKDIADCY